jgi:hypothetical protein
MSTFLLLPSSPQLPALAAEAGAHIDRLHRVEHESTSWIEQTSHGLTP